VSPSNGQPFVPSSINDLQPNYLARAISPTHGLITGTIMKILEKEKNVVIKLRQGKLLRYRVNFIRVVSHDLHFSGLMDFHNV